jgi:hypothetical protein
MSNRARSLTTQERYRRHRWVLRGGVIDGVTERATGVEELAQVLRRMAASAYQAGMRPDDGRLEFEVVVRIVGNSN